MKITNILFFIKFIINKKILSKFSIFVTKCVRKLVSIRDKKLVLLTIKNKNRKKNFIITKFERFSFNLDFVIHKYKQVKNLNKLYLWQHYYLRHKLL
jgi:hypothetical protein